MRLVSLMMLIVAAPLSFLAADDPPHGEGLPPDTAESPAPFPLGRILAASQENTVVWTPDWPRSMPPDGFRLTAGSAAAITLIMDDGAEYRAAWNSAGALTAFPSVVQGAFVQITLEAGAPGTLKGFAVTGAEGIWTVEFIDAPVPASLARITQGGAVSFAALRHDDAAETWYDPEGTALAHFDTGSLGGRPRLASRSAQGETAAEHDYNSFGAVSRIESPQGAFSALYTGHGRPRYWSRPGAGAPAENLALQWDEAGLLRSITSADTSADIRYAYTLDSKGNWTERREQAMASVFGLLAPQPPARVRRIIAYRQAAGGNAP
ncbi:MAG: hypothetical protein LBD13_07465 [Spirochaetaceae bacterium]|jgi:hypothetical protein|nr:hypothetical protein [Spirochaetaceae bacterium]